MLDKLARLHTKAKADCYYTSFAVQACGSSTFDAIIDD